MKKPAILLILLFSIGLNIILSPVVADAKQGLKKPVKVEIISPREGEVVNGKITIKARVGDPSNVDHLDFYFQEPGAKDRYGWKDYTSPYFWGGDEHMLDTTLFRDGAASAVVGCYHRDSRLSMTTDRVHFAIDNGKPKVRILSPHDQATIGADVLIKIDATDPKGIRRAAGVTAVYVYVDGGLLGKLTKKPFQAGLSTRLLAPGLHSVRVVAEDSEGLTSASVVMVKVKPETTAVTRGATAKTPP